MFHFEISTNLLISKPLLVLKYFALKKFKPFLLTLKHFTPSHWERWVNEFYAIVSFVYFLLLSPLFFCKFSRYWWNQVVKKIVKLGMKLTILEGFGLLSEIYNYAMVLDFFFLAKIYHLCVFFQKNLVFFFVFGFIIFLIYNSIFP